MLYIIYTSVRYFCSLRILIGMIFLLLNPRSFAGPLCSEVFQAEKYPELARDFESDMRSPHVDPIAQEVLKNFSLIALGGNGANLQPKMQKWARITEDNLLFGHIMSLARDLEVYSMEDPIVILPKMGPSVSKNALELAANIKESYVRSGKPIIVLSYSRSANEMAEAVLSDPWFSTPDNNGQRPLALIVSIQGAYGGAFIGSLVSKVLPPIPKVTAGVRSPGGRSALGETAGRSFFFFPPLS